jgi:hypothetical protein
MSDRSSLLSFHRSLGVRFSIGFAWMNGRATDVARSAFRPMDDIRWSHVDGGLLKIPQIHPSFRPVLSGLG